jgi:hypothetical protein
MVNDKDKMVVTETRPMGSSVAPHDHEHERSDVDIRSLLISIGVLAAVVLATCLAMWGLFQVYEGIAKKGDKAPSPVADTVSIPPEPRLQANPRADMDQMRRESDSLLGTYGQDRATRQIHIPIERAIEIMAARGGARPATAATRPGMTADTVQQAAAPGGGTGETTPAAQGTAPATHR